MKIIIKWINVIMKLKLAYKKPSKITQINMSSSCIGLNNGEDYNQKACDKIKKFTKHDSCKLVNSGNSAIFIAMNNVKGDIIIPDQGAWHGFKQIAKFLGKNLVTVKTYYGLVKTDFLDEILDDISEGSALFLTSLAAYTAEQDMKSISKYCRDNGILLVEDVSGSIGDTHEHLCNGFYSDVIVGSTGEPKIVNVGNGGFISTSIPNFFKDSNILLKSFKCDKITCVGIYNELNFAKSNFVNTVNACNILKKGINNVMHPDKRGINVIFQNDNAKELSWKLRDSFDVEGRGIITRCPNYNRLKIKGIALEVKNLDVKCLTKNNLKSIIDIINNINE